MKIKNPIGLTLVVGLMLFSLSISSQVSRKQVTKTGQTSQNRQSNVVLPTVNTTTPFWQEDFGTSEKGGDIGLLAEKAKLNSGEWSTTRLSSEGQKANNWYVSSSSVFTGLGNCSEGCLKNPGLNDRTLHIGYDYRAGDHSMDLEAIYAKNESSATDSRIESPIIDCSGKSNITLNFDYFTGGIVGEDFFSVYYFDGVNWMLLTNFGPSYVSPTCDSLDRATWKTSDTYPLPASADGNPEVKIGFRWINLASIAGNTEMYSVALDNIRLTDNTPQSVSTSTDPTSQSNKVSQTSTKKVEVETKKIVEFTVYPNPNSGQFTIDFSGIENNHEVQIVLSELQTGKQIYTTTFFSTSIEHNKIDVTPSEKIAPGRYACSLICEGIKLTKQVVIN